eukprot:5033898-Pyramimonas_sp.AAC.1
MNDVQSPDEHAARPRPEAAVDGCEEDAESKPDDGADHAEHAALPADASTPAAAPRRRARLANLQRAR